MFHRNVGELLPDYVAFKPRWEYSLISYKLKHRKYCHLYQWLKIEFTLVTGFIDHLQAVTTIYYNNATDFHTTKHSTLISSVYLH
jgi:hypothetical protein